MIAAAVAGGLYGPAVEALFPALPLSLMFAGSLMAPIAGVVIWSILSAVAIYSWQVSLAAPGSNEPRRRVIADYAVVTAITAATSSLVTPWILLIAGLIINGPF